MLAVLLPLLAGSAAPALAQPRSRTIVQPPPAARPAAAVPPSTPPTARPPSPAPAGADRRTYPVPDDQPLDYDIPNGHFYSQAVPGAPPGFGFSVTDAVGVPFWKEYVRLGGLGALGYPLSRRFASGDVVAQAFQGGLLRWEPAAGRARLEPLTPPAGLPPSATAPEPPLRLAGSAARQPWSGWWWPATSAVSGPHLFDLGGPLAKYDQFMARGGRAGPGTLEWERENIWLDEAGLSWAGHCNGWAAASVLEPEPTAPITAGGVTFDVADQKGLLSEYHFADAALWLQGSPDEPLAPADFHRRLVDWLGNDRKSFIVTFRPGGDEEVWSYPAARFELVMGPDAVDPDLTRVRATVWLADNDVAADFVGLQPWRGGGQTYEYTLVGPRDAPTGGEWSGPSAGGGFAHPAIIWYPDQDYRNLGRQLVSPNLDYKVIKRILGRR